MFDRRAWAFAGLTAALVLAPYATTSLDLRTGMMVQAVLLLALTSALLALGLSARRRDHHPAVTWRGLGTIAWHCLDPRDRANAGMWLYTSAIVWGTAVALLRGNDAILLSGQIVAMGLLPLGFAAGRLQPRNSARSLILGTCLAVSAAVVMHLAAWCSAAAAGRSMVRLFLANTVGVVGLLPISFLLLLTVRSSVSPTLRRLCDLALVLSSIYLVGSGVRGAWLSLGFASLLWVGLRFRQARVRQRRLLYRAALCALAATVFGGLLLGLPAWWLQQPFTNLLPGGEHPATWLLASEVGFDASSPNVEPPARIEWDESIHDQEVPLQLVLDVDRTYRLRAWLHGHPSSLAYVALRWRDQAGHLLHQPLDARAQPWRQLQIVTAIGRPPASSHSASLHFGVPKYGSGHRDPPAGVWTLERVELQDLGPAWTAPFWRQADYTLTRLRTLLPGEQHSATPSIDYRWLEARSLLHHFTAATWPLRLAGHGLGATYELEAGATTGPRIEQLTGRLDAARLNYIHNFYAFLLYKLGVVGSLLVATALTLWIGRASQLCQRPQTGDPLLDLVPTATLSILAAYLIWGLSSPELINFRIAPLLGLLLATTLPRRPEPSLAAAVQPEPQDRSTPPEVLRTD